MKRWLGLLAIVLLLMGAVGGFMGAVIGAPLFGNEDTAGYLQNGGFEGEFYGVGSGQVAVGWTRVQLEGNPNWMSTRVFANGGWVEKIGGANSHLLSVENLSVGQPFETVLYQQVTNLVPGEPYSFSGWLLKMYGGSANQNPPEDPYSFGSWIGVDPTGGTDPEADSVIWGEQEWQEGKSGHWENHRMAVMAEGSSVTLFVRIWLKWQRAETQAIADAMELFDAPRVTLHSTSGNIERPYLDWEGTLPEMFDERGNFKMYYEVQQQTKDESWVAIASELTDDSSALPLTKGETVILRVLPYTFQPPGTGELNWPPNTHIGLPSEPITVTYGQPESVAVQMGSLERWLDVVPFEVTWQAVGEESAGTTVAYRAVGDDSWTGWLTDTAALSATFGLNNAPVELVGGQEWELQARAHDNGEWSASIKTGLRGARLSGKVLAVNGQALLGASIAASPYPFSDAPTIDHLGNYDIPLPSSGTYTITVNHALGVAALPDTPLELAEGSNHKNWYVPPPVNRVSNGQMEEQAGGWLPAIQQVAGGASGLYAAQLTANESISQSLSLQANDALSLAWRASSEKASLRLEVGTQMWELTPTLGLEDEWASWYSGLTITGTQVLTLTALNETLLVDQLAIGQEQPLITYLYLPVVMK
jgi:hypothetical protein